MNKEEQHILFLAIPSAKVPAAGAVSLTRCLAQPSETLQKILIPSPRETLILRRLWWRAGSLLESAAQRLSEVTADEDGEASAHTLNPLSSAHTLIPSPSTLHSMPRNLN